MEQSKVEDCTLVLIHHPAGIQNGCATCRNVFSEGVWAVGLKVGRHKYVVGEDPKPLCCGDEKKAMAVFTSEKAALELRDLIAEKLYRDGTTENVYLLEPHRMISDSIH